MERVRKQKQSPILHKILDKGGGTTVEIAVLFIIGIMLLSVAYEYLRIQITANNIRSSYERAILTVAIDNYNDVYAGVREMKELGGEYEGGPGDGEEEGTTPEWVPLNDYGNVQEELKELLDLEEEGDKDISYYSETDKYRLSNITVLVRNAENTESNKYEIKGTVDASIPIYFGNVHITDAKLPIKVTTAYTAKY
ncbi:hypothetical protein [Anaeromicropila herbilytica]|uniref:Uncharacterized protein n=1 Tax=Anaeromicropila herbilytica TaxID=2785025 RepID=A0A7R7EIY0_9FIRM|nr:hypothetical protein [Anaeromicropila herbilytica]BCN29536.1 hypothetical protein bsdtb5_08310 [Anaeromicropila herbilytica]